LRFLHGFGFKRHISSETLFHRHDWTAEKKKGSALLRCPTRWPIDTRAWMLGNNR